MAKSIRIIGHHDDRYHVMHADQDIANNGWTLKSWTYMIDDHMTTNRETRWVPGLIKGHAEAMEYASILNINGAKKVEIDQN